MAAWRRFIIEIIIFSVIERFSYLLIMLYAKMKTKSINWKLQKIIIIISRSFTWSGSGVIVFGLNQCFWNGRISYFENRRMCHFRSSSFFSLYFLCKKQFAQNIFPLNLARALFFLILRLNQYVKLETCNNILGLCLFNSVSRIMFGKWMWVIYMR